jgi:tRNA-binding protein
MTKTDGDGPSPEITYEDFRRVDIRVGTITAADPFPEARRPAVKLTIDFGPVIGMKRSSAQIVTHYRLEQLVGRQIAAVVNFPRKQIGRFMSEVLVLGFPDGAGEVVMIAPDHPVPNGGRLY